MGQAKMWTKNMAGRVKSLMRKGMRQRREKGELFRLCKDCEARSCEQNGGDKGVMGGVCAGQLAAIWWAWGLNAN